MREYSSIEEALNDIDVPDDKLIQVKFNDTWVALSKSKYKEEQEFAKNWDDYFKGRMLYGNKFPETFDEYMKQIKESKKMSLISKKQQVMDIVVSQLMRTDRYWIATKTHRNKICTELDISQATYYRYITEFKELGLLETTDEDRVYFVNLNKYNNE